MPTRHEIPVADDEAVVAVHHEPTAGAGEADGRPSADTWLVHCHGFLSDKSGSYAERCERAVAEGYHGVRFDFRGCGESDGRFRDQPLSAKIADLQAVVDRFDPGRLVLFGSSFGAKVALHAAPGFAAHEGIELVGVAGRAPVTYNRSFTEARETVRREGSITYDTGQSVDWRFFEDLDGHPFAAVAGELDCPVLLVHGTDDESVPIEDSLEAARALETDVLLEKVQGEGHLFSRAAEDRLRTRLFDWLASVEDA